MPYLLKLDPTRPTYIGTALGHFAGYVYYFEGMLYGFNWSVVSLYAHSWPLQVTEAEPS